MPIYDLFEYVERQKEMGKIESEFSNHLSEINLSNRAPASEEKGSLFATISARLFFFILLLSDLIWGLYSMILFLVALLPNLLIGFKSTPLKNFFFKRYLNIKRSAISAVALSVALFSPPLGATIACSYFLMYDRKGIEEIVPSVLQEQLQEFLRPP